jgi:hypothetical protein
MFSDRFARRVARRYRKRGLSRSSRAIVSFLAARGIEGASVLEIGGGVGEMFAHPPAAMVTVLHEAGLRSTYRWRGFGWCVVGLER